MKQTKYVTEPTKLDDTVENLNIQFVNDDMVQMTYNFKDHFIIIIKIYLYRTNSTIQFSNAPYNKRTIYSTM